MSQDKDDEIARLTKEVSELKRGLADMGSDMKNMQKEFGEFQCVYHGPLPTRLPF
jgi:hypothetical protein